MWRHPKTGGWYWRLRSRHLPADLRGRGEYTSVALRAAGASLGKGATRSRPIADRVRRRLWRGFSAALAREADAGGAALAGVPVTAAGEADGAPHVSRAMVAAIELYCRFVAQRSSPDQVVRNAETLRLFARSAAVQGKGPGELVDGDLLAFLDALRKRGRSVRTIQKHRNVLCAFTRWLVAKGALDVDPAALVKVRAPGRRPPRYLDDRQQAALLKALDAHAGGKSGQACEPWLCAAVRVALFAGPRLGSLRALRWEHVKPAGLVVPLTKQDDWCVVPLSREYPLARPLRAAMAELRRIGRARGGDGESESASASASGKVFPARTAREWMDALAGLVRRHGLRGFERRAGDCVRWWRILRSTWAVNCARAGATDWQLMAWGGWKTLGVVGRYVNVARAAGSTIARGGRGR